MGIPVAVRGKYRHLLERQQTTQHLRKRIPLQGFARQFCHVVFFRGWYRVTQVFVYPTRDAGAAARRRQRQ